MASSYLWKLRSLLKKNIILMRRNFISTLFEIFFPSVIIVVILALRQAFQVDVHNFNEEGDLETFIKAKSMTSINYDSYSDLDLSGRSWNGLSLINPFQICSEQNEQYEKRGKIASLNIPLDIKTQMIRDSEIFKNKGLSTFVLTTDSFQEFDSVEQLNDYIKDQRYLAKKDEDKICFGLKFSYDEDNHKYNYSLHFFDYQKEGTEGVQDIANNAQGMFDPFQSGPDLKSFMRYQNGAYSYMMKVVNQYILRRETGISTAELNYGIAAMQYIDYRADSFGEFMGYMIGVILVMAYMTPLSLYVYRMVGDKESKIKESMKIMGLGEGQYFLSYFIQYTAINLFSSIINAALFTSFLDCIPYYYLLITLFLWSMDVFALIYFFQSFIDKTKIALVLSLVIYFMMYCVSLACMFEGGSMAAKIALSLFPQVCLNNGILLFSKFQYHFRNFKDREFLEIYTTFSVGLMYLMFVLDFFLFLFLGFYLHNVIPHDFGIRKPFYFLCTSEFWCSNKKKKSESKKINDELNDEENIENKENNDVVYKNKENILNDQYNLYENSPNFESEEIYKNRTKKDDVFKIRDIVKVFGDGKVAVNKVNLNFYKDEIFALLGHNGAGKTTLISMLTGMYEASNGVALYEDVNILDSMNMEVFREKLGICPQHDILFEDLNIREHLEMFSIFKGVDSKEVENEVNKTLHDFQLEDIQYMLAKNLSAGQRRKLSISISLIGGSKVIFLDEPSSGMDITSRRNLWEILKRQTDGKIIILTTHYMEEASVLGKRIGIINAGKMKCIGSPLFLIEKYGRFMSLNVTKEENCDSQKVIDFVKNNAENTEYEALSEEIMFRIPIKSEDNGKKIKFDLKSFFTNFDNNIKQLKIKSYSVSMPTLEDVFLNVAAEDKNNSKEELELKKKEEQENDQILYNSNLREDYTQKSKFVNDFKICLKRRYLITKRDLKGFLMEILSPIILTLFGLLLSKIDIGYKSGPVEVSFEEISKQRILYSSYVDSIPVENYFITGIDGVTSAEVDGFSSTSFVSKQEAIKKYIEKIYEIEKDTEDSSIKEVDMTSDDYEAYFGSLLMLEQDDTNKKYEFVMVLNARVRQGLPIYSYYFLKKIIEKACGHDVDISYTHYPLPLTHDLNESKSFGGKIAIVFFLAIAYALIPANFITLYVKERANNSKHLMRVSGINITSYWLVNYIFELIKYYITGGICILLLYLFDSYKDYLYIVYLTFGPSMVSSTYCLSFFFTNESDAQNTIILINFLFGYLGSIIVNVLRTIKSVKLAAKVIEYIFAIVPIFCFDFSFILLINNIGIYVADYPNEFMFFKGDEMIKRFNLMLSMIIYSSVECVLYTLLLILIENLVYCFKKSEDIMLTTDINDSEVIKEINKVNTIDICPSEEDLIRGDVKNGQTIDGFKEIIPDIYSVKLKNLRKIYFNGCCSDAGSEIVAIKNLNFAIKPGECFGLLGLNGAGKTTTFKCITQEIAPDNGKIFVNNMDISGHFSQLNELFGYCPQFDAIFELLTVYENLEFYASIKGIKKDSIKLLVNAMIKEMSLDEFTNKIAGRLSGGNKRKLAVAISMLCNPPIILLDEPSTGMDPEARRFMWSVIHKMSTKGRKSSVIMTTHSMDEAETLCKRMGIMVNGEFVCMGKANQIKDKYGFGYEADVRIKPMTEIQKAEIMVNCNFEKGLLVDENNIKEVLTKLNKINYLEELKENRLGERIKREIDLNGNILIDTLLNWIFFVENAIKFIIKGKNYFEEIILSEHIENNFLFKMKKENSDKSIGFFFGLFEESKEQCFVTEYSIQKTSLEQIFNKFAQKQGKSKEQIYEDDNTEDENKKNIIIDDVLIKKLI